MTRHKTAAIIANGSSEGLSALKKDLGVMDMIIAADGGADVCQALGITPSLIIGDLDSISPKAHHHFETAGVEFHRHPADKDQSDLELAVNAAVSSGAAQLTICCAMGGRWDMTAANMQLLLSPQLKQTATLITDGRQHMRLLSSGDRFAFSGHPGDLLSLIPMGDAVGGISASGVAWPLDNDVLYPWQSRGVSNRFIDGTAIVSVTTGHLLCIHTEGPLS